MFGLKVYSLFFLRKASGAHSFDRDWGLFMILAFYSLLEVHQCFYRLILQALTPSQHRRHLKEANRLSSVVFLEHFRFLITFLLCVLLA